MKLEIVIDSRSDDNWIALLKDGKLIELHEDRGGTDFSVGDIYLGKVRRVVPSLNAAFVDVGYEKDAFLHYLDLGPQYNSFALFCKNSLRGKQNVPDLRYFKLEKDLEKEGKISEVLSSSQSILVQIAKEPISAKGPRLCSEVTIAGRYLVLVPFSDKVSISQKIKENAERSRLKKIMQQIKPKNFGVIIRTVAENQSTENLENDIKQLLEKWGQMYENIKGTRGPKKLLGELNRTSSMLRDLLNGDFANIHVNNDVLYDEVKEYVSSIAPGKEKIVKHYSGKLDVFERFGISKQIKTLFGKKVPLNSGGYLIIEHTEAMHVIDVNSGNRKGGVKNQEDNALQTNLECAREIARVLRLRDMGGIICIDFIDMHERANQRKLLEALKDAMKDDRAKHNILPPSRFGVVEITRQRVRPVTNIKTSEKCPSCDGKGVIEAPVLFTDEIESSVKMAAAGGQKEILAMVHPMVEAYLNKGFLNSIAKTWKKKYATKLKVEASNTLEFLEYQLYNKAGEEID